MILLATPDALRDLMRTLEERGAPRVVAVHGPHAHDALSAALEGRARPTSVDADATRFRTDDELWLHDGPGARAVADVRATAHRVAPHAAPLWLSGATVAAGVPGIATHVHMTGPVPCGAARPTRTTRADGPANDEDILRAFDRGDLMGAHVAWEHAGSPLAFAWTETLRLTLCRRYQAAWEHAASTPDIEPAWRWFAWSYLSFQALDYPTVRRVVAHGLTHGRDPTALGALRATAAVVEATEPPSDAPRWMVAYHAMIHGRPPPDTPFARALYEHGNDPLPAVGRGVFTNAWVQSPHDPLAMRALRDLWRRHQAEPGSVGAHDVPPQDVLGVFERAGCLVRGQLALRDGDMVTLRRCAEELPRTTAQVMPRAMIDGALHTDGVPWARRIWLEALATTYGDDLPGLAPVLDDARAAARMLDDYELLDAIAQGSSGAVWNAVHRPTGTPVAIKTLIDTADPERFRREIDLVSRLEHPAIAAVLDRGVVRDASIGPTGAPYLVMELVGSGTLKSRRGQLPWSDLHPLVLALLDALAYAHAAGVLHRDVKPDNVLVHQDGGVRLSDFGLAALPRRGAVAGTPAYMAPEQLQGEVHRASDLYALGATVWALCAGRSPLPSKLAARRAHDPADLGPFRPVVAVPADLDEWLAKAMAPTIGGRFRDAAEMAAAWDTLGPAVEPTTRRMPVARVEEPTFVLHELLDLPPGRDDESTLSLSRTGALWHPARRSHWRPRLPTPRLLDAGDPPMLFREEAQEALWLALVRAMTGEGVHVHLRGPPQCGRRRLLEWLPRHAAATGLRLGEGQVGRPRLEAPAEGTGPVPPATLRVSWSADDHASADKTISLPRYTPLQVFWMLRSRTRVPLALATRAARLAVGRPGLAVQHLEDWLTDPGAAPGRHDHLQLLRPPPRVGRRALAFWGNVVAQLPDEERRSWQVLAAQAAGFDASQATEVLPAHGYAPVDPGAMAAREPVHWMVPPALAAALGPAPAADVHAVARTREGSELHRLFVALTGGADPWEALRAVPPHKRIDPLMEELLWAQALDRGDAPYHAVWRLRLARTEQPLFHAHDALAQGDPVAAAMAYARASASQVVPATLDELARLRRLYDLLGPDDPQGCGSEVAMVMAMLNVTAGDAATADWLRAEEAQGRWTAVGHCLVRRSLAQAVGDEAHMRGLLDVLHHHRPSQAYTELLVSAVAMWALDRRDTQLARAAFDTLQAPPAFVTGLVTAALMAVDDHDLAGARQHLEQAFVTYAQRSQFLDLGWCLWLALELDAPDARWNDLASEVRPPPSPALAHALRALAPYHLRPRAERLRAVADRADRPISGG